MRGSTRQARRARSQASSRSTSATTYSPTAYGVNETSRTHVPPAGCSTRAAVSSAAGTSSTVTSSPRTSQRSFMRPR